MRTFFIIIIIIIIIIMTLLLTVRNLNFLFLTLLNLLSSKNL
jgi:hypothetical protein